MISPETPRRMSAGDSTKRLENISCRSVALEAAVRGVTAVTSTRYVTGWADAPCWPLTVDWALSCADWPLPASGCGETDVCATALVVSAPSTIAVRILVLTVLGTLYGAGSKADVS